MCGYHAAYVYCVYHYKGKDLVLFQGMQDIGEALKGDLILVQQQSFHRSINLQRFCQQTSTEVPHFIPADIQILQTGRRAEGVQ